MSGSGSGRDPVDAAHGFLSRWSRRKVEHRSGQAQPADDKAAALPAAASGVAGTAPDAAAAPPLPPPELPPVESLTPESDFSVFMQPAVEQGVRRAALKKLFADPHFNVMDGLDTYIDDYTQPDPIPEALMKKLYQARQHVYTPEQNKVLEEEDRIELERARQEPASAEAAPAAAEGADAPAHDPAVASAPLPAHDPGAPPDPRAGAAAAHPPEKLA